MNNCFENYISLEGLSPEISPRSTLYINDLPGVTLDMFEALMKGDHEDTLEFWTKLYKRGVENFIDKVSNKLDGSFNVAKVIDSQKTGVFIKPFELNNYETSESGVKLDLVHTKYSQTEISTISIYSVEAVPEVEILIIDDETEEELWSETIDLTEGVNIIDVFENFDRNKLRIVYDPTLVASYRTKAYSNDSSSYYSSSCVSCNNGSTSITQLNGGGLIVEFTTKCSVEKFICSQLSRFKLAFWNWLGVELMTEALMSKNTNCFTIDVEEAKRNMSFFESEFNEKIDSVIKNLKIKDDHVCFECKGAITRKISLP
jgi:hypothetical protein